MVIAGPSTKLTVGSVNQNQFPFQRSEPTDNFVDEPPLNS